MGRYRINQSDNTIIDLAPPGSGIGGGIDTTAPTGTLPVSAGPGNDTTASVITQDAPDPPPFTSTVGLITSTGATSMFFDVQSAEVATTPMGYSFVNNGTTHMLTAWSTSSSLNPAINFRGTFTPGLTSVVLAGTVISFLGGAASIEVDGHLSVAGMTSLSVNSNTAVSTATTASLGVTASGEVVTINSAGTLNELTDVTLTSAANDNIIQRKSGTFVNRTPSQLLVDLLTGTGNGVLTNTNGILGTTTLPSPPQSGVNPNPTDGRIPLGQGLNADFVDSTIAQTTDTLLTFDATIHHDQGGRDFNIYPTGVLADFVTNPTNYDFSVVTSSTTNGTEGFTSLIFDANVTRSGNIVTIVSVADAVAFSQGQITGIRVGTVVPVASGLANITGLDQWSTTTSTVRLVFNNDANAITAQAALQQTQARLTVTSNVDTIQVAAYNANGEGMLAAFLDGRLAEGDRVRFTQRVANLETHLRVSSDVVNIDEHLIVDGPTNLNGTVSFGGRVTVPEPTDAADAARNDTTWRSAIADSGIRGTTTTQSAGGRTGISVTALTGVENAGPHTNWWIWTGVALNDDRDGFGIAFENVVYSTSGTDPFAAGTSTVNAPVNIQATADQTFHRDVDVASDIVVRGDSTVLGTITTGTGNSGLTIMPGEELYATLSALATNAIVATADIPSAFSTAALVQSRTLTQNGSSTLYYSVYNTGFTTDTLYISTDLTNAIHTKTLQ